MKQIPIETASLVAISVISFAAAFTSSAVNLAIPAIGAEFGASTLLLSWVVSGYVLASAATLMSFGRLADIAGRKKVYLAGVFAFTITSFMCAMSWSISTLLASRVLQGTSAAMIFSTQMAILSSVHPPESRGRAIGLAVASTYVGLSAGPAVGGLLCDLLGWRSLFFTNAATGIMVFLFSIRYLKGEWKGSEGERFDFVGSILYAVGLTAVLFSLSTLGTYGSARYLLAGGLAILVLFVRHELGHRYPLIRLHLFTRNMALALSCLAAMIDYAATAAMGFIMSLHLQVVLGYRPQTAGLIMLAQPIVMAIFSPLAGALSDRIKPYIVASWGMALSCTGLLVFALTLHIAPVWLIMPTLACIGLGFAMFSSPNSNAIMGIVEPRFYGIASSSIATMRVIGQALSMATVTLLMSLFVGNVELRFADPASLVMSSRTAFAVFTVLCAFGTLASFARGRVKSDTSQFSR